MNNSTAIATNPSPRQGRHWTDQELVKVATLAHTHTNQEIAQILGRTAAGVAQIRCQKNLGRVSPVARAKFFQPDLFDKQPTINPQEKPPVYRMGARWVTEMGGELYELVPLKRQ